MSFQKQIDVTQLRERLEEEAIKEYTAKLNEIYHDFADLVKAAMEQGRNSDVQEIENEADRILSANEEWCLRKLRRIKNMSPAEVYRLSKSLKTASA